MLRLQICSNYRSNMLNTHDLPKTNPYRNGVEIHRNRHTEMELRSMTNHQGMKTWDYNKSILIKVRFISTTRRYVSAHLELWSSHFIIPVDFWRYWKPLLYPSPTFTMHQKFISGESINIRETFPKRVPLYSLHFTSIKGRRAFQFFSSHACGINAFALNNQFIIGN